MLTDLLCIDFPQPFSYLFVAEWRIYWIFTKQENLDRIFSCEF